MQVARRLIALASFCVLLVSSAAQSQDGKKDVPPISGETETRNKNEDKTKAAQEITINLPSGPFNVTVGGRVDVVSEQKQPGTNEEPSKWADPITWFTAVLAVANLLLWGTTRRLANEAEASGKTAEKIAITTHDAYIAEQRPWVSVEVSFDGDLVYKSGRYGVDVNFSMKNHGKTPAINAMVYAVIFPYSGDPRPKQLELRTKAKQRAGDPEGLGSVLFPGQPLIEPRTLWFTKAEVDSYIAERRQSVPDLSPAPEDDLLFDLSLVGCIDYIFTFDEPRHHQTGFSFEIRRNNPTTGKRTNFTANETVVRDDLVLRPSIIGYFAD